MISDLDTCSYGSSGRSSLHSQTALNDRDQGGMMSRSPSIYPCRSTPKYAGGLPVGGGLLSSSRKNISRFSRLLLPPLFSLLWSSSNPYLSALAHPTTNANNTAPPSSVAALLLQLSLLLSSSTQLDRIAVCIQHILWLYVSMCVLGGKTS
jgi:hypothetical protein